MLPVVPYLEHRARQPMALYLQSQERGYPWSRNTAASQNIVAYKPTVPRMAIATTRRRPWSVMAGALMPAQPKSYYRPSMMRPGMGSNGKYRRVGYYGRYSGVLPEKKFLDWNQAITSTATNGVIYDAPTLIAQGVGESQRVGRKCCVYSISMRVGIILTTQTDFSKTEGIIRIMIYIDHQTNGAAASVTDILETATWDAYRNLAQQERFTILKDKFITMNATGGAGNGTSNDSLRSVKLWKTSKKCKIPIEYNSTLGAITEIKSNSLGVLVIGSDANVSYTIRSRVRFGDCLS